MATPKSEIAPPDYQYEVAFSFASEYREEVRAIAEAVAAKLAGRKHAVLFDEWVKGIDGRYRLDRFLLQRYEKSRLLVYFLCKEYDNKEWTDGVESRLRDDLLKQGEYDRLMLIKFDDGPFTGIRSNDHPWDARNKTPEEAAEKILGRLDYIKPVPQTSRIIAALRNRTRARIEHLCGTIRILGMEKPVPVDKLYTDINILESRPSNKYVALDELAQNRSANPSEFFGELGKRIARVPGLSAFDASRHIVIYGGPGAGKTTFLKRLAIHCIRGEFRPGFVPVFVSLKEFAETEGAPGLYDYIDSVCELNPDTRAALSSGNALILLDGLDEVRNADYDRVRKSIESFTKTFYLCTIALTCRTASRENRLGLESFAEIEIADFEPEQIAQFTENWFRAHGAPQKTEAFLSKLSENDRLQELATKPLLLTLLCLVFQEGFKFDNRTKLYEKGLTVLLEIWDGKRLIERDRPHGLTIAVMTSLLEEIAYTRFLKNEYFFGRTDIQRQIRDFFDDRPGLLAAGEQLNAPEVLSSAEAHIGLLVQRANEIYSFSHLTFQEFLTAQRVAKRRELLAEIGPLAWERRWREVWLSLVAMADADSILLQLKQHVDAMMAGQRKLQAILRWTSIRSRKTTSTLNQPQLRCVYLKTAMPPSFTDLFSDSFGKTDLHFLGALSNDSTDDNVYDIATKLDLDLNLNLDLDLTATLHHFGHSNHISTAIDLAGRIDAETTKALAAELLELQRIRPLSSGPAVREHQQWAAALQKTMIRHRDIGHDWSLNDEQHLRLRNYYAANRLLVNCIGSAPTLTRRTRQYLEDTILLPASEIAKIPKP